MAGNTAPHSLLQPQSIVAVLVMLIFAATVGAVILWGDPATRAQTVGGVIGIAGIVVGFYFTSSTLTNSSTKTEPTAKPDAATPAPVTNTIRT